MPCPDRAKLALSFLLAGILWVQSQIGRSADDAEPAAARETPPAGALRVALDRKVSLDFDGVPLQKAIASIKQSQHVAIEIDQQALEDAGIAADTPISFQASDITLRSALWHLLSQAELTYLLREDSVLVTTPDPDDDNVSTTKVYNVQDLVLARNAFGEQECDYDRLVELIAATIEPQSWDVVGGQGSINGIDGTLVVSQTRDNHDQLRDLLAAIRKVRERQQSQPGGAAEWLDNDELDLAARQAILQSLAKKVSLRFHETPLAEAVAALRTEHHLPVMIDLPAIKEAGGLENLLVTVDVQDVPLREALRVMLAKINLAYSIESEMLVITTAENAAGELAQVVYPVGDLIESLDRAGIDDTDDACQNLAAVIKASVAPTSWQDVGERGALEPLAVASVLVCSQTAIAQDDVARLLAQLRQVMEDRVAVGSSSGSPPKQAAAVLKTRVYKLRQSDTEESQVSAAEAAKLIEEIVEPQSWKAEGVLLRPLGDKVVVRQTPAVHKQVVQLLNKLELLTSEHARNLLPIKALLGKPPAAEPLPDGRHDGSAEGK